MVVEQALVLDILLLLSLGLVLGELFEKLALPKVIGELVAGLILGPSLLGLVNPSEELEVLALIGVVFFMLTAGLEIDIRYMVHRAKEGLAVAFFGVIMPFTLGYWIANLYGYSIKTSLALATCLSITAIGLSIRVFMDLHMLHTRMAIAVVNAAVVDDVIGLILMTIALTLALEEAIALHIIARDAIVATSFLISMLALAYILSRSRSIRLKISKILYMKSRNPRLSLAIAVVLTLFLSLLATASYLHVVIGAFVAGILLRNLIGEEIERTIYNVTFAFFALLFFTYVGVQTNLRILVGVTDLTMLVIAVAFIGKILGGYLGARFLRLKHSEALIVGIAMNSRAAVELAISTTFLAVGVFDEILFSSIVLMAAVTSISTPILLKLAIKYLL